MKNRIRIARGPKSALTNSNTNIEKDANGKVIKGTPIYTTDERKLYISNGNQTPEQLQGINAVGAEKLVNISSGTVTNQSTTNGKLMYVDSADGKVKDCNITKGSSTKPVYMDNGEIKESSATVGGTTGTSPNQTTYPVYLSSGVIKALNSKLSNDISGNANTATLATNSINAIKKSDDSGYYGINAYMNGGLDFLYLNLNDQVDNTRVLWLPYLERMVSIAPIMELQDNASISFRSSKRFNFAT